jgi:hypothetical protein
LKQQMRAGLVEPDGQGPSSAAFLLRAASPAPDLMQVSDVEVAHGQKHCSHPLGLKAEAGPGAMLVAFRLTGLSALEGHYASVIAATQLGRSPLETPPERRRAHLCWALHDHEARPLKMLNEPLRNDLGRC